MKRRTSWIVPVMVTACTGVPRIVRQGTVSSFDGESAIGAGSVKLFSCRHHRYDDLFTGKRSPYSPWQTHAGRANGQARHDINISQVLLSSQICDGFWKRCTFVDETWLFLRASCSCSPNPSTIWGRTHDDWATGVRTMKSTGTSMAGIFDYRCSVLRTAGIHRLGVSIGELSAIPQDRSLRMMTAS